MTHLKVSLLSLSFVSIFHCCVRVTTYTTYISIYIFTAVAFLYQTLLNRLCYETYVMRKRAIWVTSFSRLLGLQGEVEILKPTLTEKMSTEPTLLY